jgi:hypothetical protein
MIRLKVGHAARNQIEGQDISNRSQIVELPAHRRFEYGRGSGARIGNLFKKESVVWVQGLGQHIVADCTVSLCDLSVSIPTELIKSRIERTWRACIVLAFTDELHHGSRQNITCVGPRIIISNKIIERENHIPFGCGVAVAVSRTGVIHTRNQRAAHEVRHNRGPDLRGGNVVCRIRQRYCIEQKIIAGRRRDHLGRAVNGQTDRGGLRQGSSGYDGRRRPEADAVRQYSESSRRARNVRGRLIGAGIGIDWYDGNAFACLTLLIERLGKLAIKMLLNSPGGAGKVGQYLVLVIKSRRDHEQRADRRKNEHSNYGGDQKLDQRISRFSGTLIKG